jgi:hypothetical protein
MDVKKAVAVAKDYVADLFHDEATGPPTLEEVRFDEAGDEWLITLGVRRESSQSARNFRDLLGENRKLPDYKVVRISDKHGTVKGIAIREPGGA